MVLDGYEVLDPTFSAHIIEPLMPVNPLWRAPLSNDIQEVGLLLETHVISCFPSMLPLGRVWWPLSSATMSRNLNVSNILKSKF